MNFLPALNINMTAQMNSPVVVTRHLRGFVATSILIAVLTGCGGGGGGGGGSTTQEQPLSAAGNALLDIDKDNAIAVVEHSTDSTGVLLKLSVQLQEAVDALVVSGEDSLTFECEASGDITLTMDTNSNIIADFNSCWNSRMKEIFDGELRIIPFTLAYNLANEVHLTGAVVIEDALSLDRSRYTSVSGSYFISLQSTWHGDTIEIDYRETDPIVFIGSSGDITLNDLSAEVDFDMDMGVTSYPRSYLYGRFGVSIYSTELRGEFRCGSTDDFTMGGVKASDFDIYCSGNVEDALYLEEGGVVDITVSLLNETTRQYEAIWAHNWGYIADLFEYQPGLPDSNMTVPAISSQDISIEINDAVYSQASGTFFASVSQSALSYANHLVELDADSGRVLRSVALKGEAGPLGLASDGALYLGYRTINEIQRFDLDTFTPNVTYPLIIEGSFEDTPAYANYIEVSPASNDTIAITLVDTNDYPLRGRVIIDGAIYDLEIATRVHFSADGSQVVTYTNRTTHTPIKIYSTSPAGVSETETLNGLVSGIAEFVMGDDLLYHGIGRVINLETSEYVGTNTNLTGFDFEEFEPASPLLSPDGRHTYIYSQYVEVFDRDRFTYLGAFDPEMSGRLIRFNNIGNDKFALVSNQGIKIFSHSDVPSDRDYQCDQYDVLDIRTELDMSMIDCLINDAIYSSVHDKVFASIPGASGINGNAIAVINSQSLLIEQYIPVESEPTELELNGSQQTLYVAYDGTNKYSEIDLDTLTVGLAVDLGMRSSFDGPLFVSDIEPFPEDDRSVAISYARKGYTTDFVGMAVYTNGVKAPEDIYGSHLHQNANRFRFTDSNVVLGYNTDDTSFQLSEFSVDQSGVTYIRQYKDLISGFASELELSNGRLYSSRGYVVDTETMEQVGVMDGLNTDNFTRHQFVVDEDRGVLYVYASMLVGGNDPVLKVYSLDTLEELAAHKMPAFAVLLGEPKALLNMDGDRLVVVLENAIYSFDKNDLVP